MVRDVDQARGIQYKRGKAEETDPKVVCSDLVLFFSDLRVSLVISNCALWHTCQEHVYGYLAEPSKWEAGANPHLLGEELS